MNALGGALAAEWLKLRTVRSTYGIMAVVAGLVAAMGLLCWYAAHLWDTLGPERRAGLAVSPPETITAMTAELCLAILGVLTITAEYRTGTIRTTLAAVPVRRAVLAAKALVVAAVAAGSGFGATLVTVGIRRLVVGGRPISGIVLVSGAGGAGTLAAMGLSVVMFALLGLALGALTRSAVASIGGLAALWYLVPLIVFHLPAPWAGRIGSVLPGALAGELADFGDGQSVFGHALAPPAALALMVAYAVVPLLAAAVVFERRDA